MQLKDGKALAAVTKKFRKKQEKVSLTEKVPLNALHKQITDNGFFLFFFLKLFPSSLPTLWYVGVQLVRYCNEKIDKVEKQLMILNEMGEENGG